MNQGYRDELAAAQARIADLEAELAGGRGADVAALEAEHAALVRSVPTQERVWLSVGLSIFVAVVTVGSMLFLQSAYDHHPRFTVALDMLIVSGMVFSSMATWVGRSTGLRAVALSERLLAAERAKAALEAHVRVGQPTRVASAEAAPLDEEEELAKRTSPMRR